MLSPSPGHQHGQRKKEAAVTEHYDVIIIGTGAGGGTLAHGLAGSGKKILLLERGNFLPREMDNCDPRAVFVDGKYISKDTWFGLAGKPFQPQVHRRRADVPGTRQRRRGPTEGHRSAAYPWPAVSHESSRSPTA
jgi:choline dehydrogenase-like flavoprotein